MPVAVACPACGSKFRVSSKVIGKKGKCAKCNETFTLQPPDYQGTPIKSEPQTPNPLPQKWSFLCPGCQTKLKARPHLIGRKVKCPSCGDPIMVVGPAPAAPPDLPGQDAKRTRPKPDPKATQPADKPIAGEEGKESSKPDPKATQPEVNPFAFDSEQEAKSTPPKRDSKATQPEINPFAFDTEEGTKSAQPKPDPKATQPEDNPFAFDSGPGAVPPTTSPPGNPFNFDQD